MEIIPSEIIEYIIQEYRPQDYYRRQFSILLKENIENKLYTKCCHCHYKFSNQLITFRFEGFIHLSNFQIVYCNPYYVNDSELIFEKYAYLCLNCFLKLENDIILYNHD